MISVKHAERPYYTLKPFDDSLNIVVILAPCHGFFFAKCGQFQPNIYGVKLNEGHFSSGTDIIHFWDKSYQEINFKGYLNSISLCK